MVTFRQANEDDLIQARAIYYYASGMQKEADALPPPTTPSKTLTHILRTGVVYVAEEQGRILAFAGAITRDKITFLTDLFVLPDQQSTRLGQTLLQHVLPSTANGIRCTLSSTDPRALALYTRAGMLPQWPHFPMLLENATQARIPATHLKVVEAQADDPELLTWDAQVSGRRRSQDHAYWIDEQQGMPLWFQRAGKTVGYGYVRPGVSMLLHPTVCSIGPIGASSPDDAVDCVMAAVDWARQRANTLYIEVPGPHPCLTPLLEARFHIQYIDTYMSSAPEPFFDPTRYIASGSDLF